MSERMLVLAMTMLLGALGLWSASCADDPQTQAVSQARECVVERITGTDQAITQHLVEVYDAAGRRVEARLTIDDDGWDDATTTFTYDAAGHLIRSATTSAGPLGGPFSRDFVYDSQGWLDAISLTGEVTDFWAKTIDLQYAGASSQPSRVIVDTGYEHVVDTLSYDDDGRVSARLREYQARAGAPAPTLTRETFVYTDGELSEVRRDVGADDTVDDLYRVERDASGRVVRAGQFDRDGVWIEGNLYTWTGARVDQLRWESTLDGIERYDFSYDASGQIASVASSYGVDSAVSYRLEMRGGRVGATCVDGFGAALAAPLDRFYRDPASHYLYDLPGVALP